MTKAELLERLHKGAGKGLSKKALAAVVDEVFDHIAKSVKKDKRFAYPGFGTWSLRKRAARVGRNPKTGEEIKINASRTVTFKPSPQLKSSL
ncbi:MAG: HU family DNA-binding protein [Deltaproteobacteria bacterium]|nr:HU family DNA-binding protein [Deltaproteobacteria bacterium]